MCQCPLGLLPHFYSQIVRDDLSQRCACQCPLGLLPHFYRIMSAILTQEQLYVSMPSRAVTSFLPVSDSIETAVEVAMCQCPLGLLPHFYRVDISTRETCIKYCVNALSGCYLISTKPCGKSGGPPPQGCVNALSGCYLISTSPTLFSVRSS